MESKSRLRVACYGSRMSVYKKRNPEIFKEHDQRKEGKSPEMKEVD